MEGVILLNELTMEQETILLLSKVLENYPGVSTELIQKAFIDACLEINMMSEPQKRSLVNEKIEMMKTLQESDK